MTEPHLSLSDVSKTYALGRARFGGPERYVHAVDRVSLDVAHGETLGLVGESGCGKSTLARLIMQLERPSSGTISIEGEDLSKASPRALKAARRSFQMIFQDPYSSLNPRMSARAIIAEALRNYRVGDKAAIDARTVQLAHLAGLSDYHLDRYPHELSGGQCQRVGIARALACDPRLLVLDEPVSALDPSVRAGIVNLLTDLREELGLGQLFIGHDLALVRHVAQHVAVLRQGRIVEHGPVQRVWDAPAHDYTRELLAAVPELTRAGT
jgi:ABC-type glutathione transport system ATPase component